MYFTCKIKYDKLGEDGIMKKETETYLLDALSFTEAEAHFIQEMEPYISGEYEVTDIKKTKIAEIFESNDSLADRWYMAKVAFITLDEKSGKEKKTISPMLVQAISFQDALKSLLEAMAGTLGDFTITSLTETPIMDYYKADLSGNNAKKED